MMTFKSSIVETVFVLVFLMLIGCSEEEESKIELSYTFETLKVPFHSVGESTAPMVKWNGEIGMFFLKNPVNGISIDPDTGIIIWNEFLSIGDNSITVIAQNQESRTEISLTMESTLAETYWLGWQNNDIEDNSPLIGFLSRQIKLNLDGSVTSKIIGEEGSEGVGIWSRNENSIEIHLCSYCSDLDPFSIPEYDEHSFYLGTLSNSGNEVAIVRGQWYRVDLDPDSTTLRGQFGLLISDENFSH